MQIFFKGNEKKIAGAVNFPYPVRGCLAGRAGLIMGRGLHSSQGLAAERAMRHVPEIPNG
jgi:hypothetical protein